MDAASSDLILDYFKLLVETFDKLHLHNYPEVIWNLDEKGWSNQQAMQQSVIATEGKPEVILSPDESRGYLGFSSVMPPQSFPFLNAITSKVFKLDLPNSVCGYIWAIPQTLLFSDLDLQFIGHLWPLKGQILAIFSHFGSVLTYRKLDHPMAGNYKVPDRGHFWVFWRYFHI